MKTALRELRAKDIIEGSDDKLLGHEGDYDSYYGNIDIMYFERPDGTQYTVTTTNMEEAGYGQFTTELTKDEYL